MRVVFGSSNLTWRRAHVTAGLTGKVPNVNVNVMFCGVFVSKYLVKSTNLEENAGKIKSVFFIRAAL